MKEVEIGGRKVKVTSSVDACGLFCPMPIVKLKLELEKVTLDEIVELLADDAGVLEDLPSWCNETGNRLLSLKKNQEGVYVAYVRKEEIDYGRRPSV